MIIKCTNFSGKSNHQNHKKNIDLHKQLLNVPLIDTGCSNLGQRKFNLTP